MIHAVLKRKWRSREGKDEQIYRPVKDPNIAVGCVPSVVHWASQSGPIPQHFEPQQGC